MPRFGTKALLIGFAVAALWLSTFGGYAAAQDVRRSILLLILVTSGAVAVYSHGKRRAFWSAFFFVMLLCGGLNLYRPLYRYVPDFAWIELIGINIQPAPSAPTPSVASPVYIPATPPANSYRVAPSISQPLQFPVPAFALTYPAVGSTVREARNDTIAAGWTIALSLLAGFVAAYLYAQLPTSANESR